MTASQILAKIMAYVLMKSMVFIATVPQLDILDLYVKIMKMSAKENQTYA